MWCISLLPQSGASGNLHGTSEQNRAFHLCIAQKALTGQADPTLSMPGANNSSFEPGCLSLTWQTQGLSCAPDARESTSCRRYICTHCDPQLPLSSRQMYRKLIKGSRALQSGPGLMCHGPVSVTQAQLSLATFQIRSSECPAREPGVFTTEAQAPHGDKARALLHLSQSSRCLGRLHQRGIATKMNTSFNNRT